MFPTFKKTQFFWCQLKTMQKFEFFGKAWVLGCWDTQKSFNLNNYLIPKILSLKSLGIIKIHFQAQISVFCNCLFFKILRIDFFQKKCKKIPIFWFKLVDKPNSSKFFEFFFPFNPRFFRYRTFKKIQTIMVIYIWD